MTFPDLIVKSAAEGTQAPPFPISLSAFGVSALSLQHLEK